MAPRKAGWIDWRKSKARAIILRDLEPGGMLEELDELGAKDVLEYYQKNNCRCCVGAVPGTVC